MPKMIINNPLQLILTRLEDAQLDTMLVWSVILLISDIDYNKMYSIIHYNIYYYHNYVLYVTTSISYWYFSFLLILLIWT